MALQWTDLIQVAELLQLGAETAKLFAEETANGQASRIMQLTEQIEAAALELAVIGRELDERL